MDDIELDIDDYEGPKRPRLRIILITVLFPFIMGWLLGSGIKNTELEKLLENPEGTALFLGISTGATLLIWGAGLYQAKTKGRAFGMKKTTWSFIILGGHLAGIIFGAFK